MCAIIEILLKKEGWSIEEEREVEAYMIEHDFPVYMETKRSVRHRDTLHRQNDEQYLLLTCESRISGECLCSVLSDEMKHVLQGLRQFADEVQYDASADMNHSEHLFWEAQKEISLTDTSYDWSPKMYPVERVKIK